MDLVNNFNNCTKFITEHILYHLPWWYQAQQCITTYNTFVFRMKA